MSRHRALPYHQHHDARTADAWRLAGLTLEQRGALISIIHTTNQFGPQPAANEQFWINQLCLKDPRPWRRVLKALVSAGMVRIQNGLLMPVQFLGFSSNVWGTSAQRSPNVGPTASESPNDFNEPRRIDSDVSSLKSAYQEEEVSRRRYPQGGEDGSSRSIAPIRHGTDDDDGWPGPNVVPLHGGVR
jgi:hypothetical protein